MTRNEGGFTLVEVLIAVVVLGIGVTALVGSSALVTRMVGPRQGRDPGGPGGQPADRDAAGPGLLHGHPLHRASFASGGPVTTNGIRERWIVSVAGKVASVSDTVTHRVARGTHTDVLTTRIEC